MLKYLSILIAGGLIPATSTLVDANPVENKPSLAIFSELKQQRSNFPVKSKFETEEEYQRKISAINISANPIRLELSPESGKYNPENQHLEIKLDTSYTSISSSAREDEKLAKKKLFEGHYKKMLEYRTDSQTLSQEIITCVNGFGVRYKYLHSTKKSNNYLINTLGIDMDESIILKMPPQEARKYFKLDETSLNDRLQVRINLTPLAPFYTKFTTYSGNQCPQSDLERSFANLVGTIIDYETNHLIHAEVSYFEVFDKVTGKTLYSISPNRQDETKLSVSDR